MKNGRQTRLADAYVLTATLLVAHQIDSAYWEEWRLFGIGGGIQGFVLLNVPLVLLFLYGLLQVAGGRRGGAWFGVALSAVGVGAFAIHAWLLYRGHTEFRVPVSLAVLGGAFLSSVGLAWLSLGWLRAQG